MKKAILHISDLHVSRNTSIAGKPLIPDSWFITKPDDDILSNYLRDFVEKVKSNHPNNQWTIIISGDITNEGDELEFEVARNLIEKLKNDLKVNDNSILLVPGDHDVNRHDSRTAFLKGQVDNHSKKSFEYHQEKYAKFSSFYNSIIKEKFNPNLSIVRSIEIPEYDLLLVGINSNFKIDFEGGLGHINIDQLESELKTINKNHPNQSKVAVFHHNIFSNYENKKTGQWDGNNRPDVIAELEKHNFKLLLFGNEHTRSSGIEGSFYFSDSGSLGKKDPFPSFKVYELVSSSGRISLKQSLYLLLNKKGIQDKPFGRWGIQNNKDQNEIEEFVLKEPPASISVDALLVNEIEESNITEIHLKEETNNEDDAKEEKVSSENIYTDDYYQNYIFEKVKEKNLYHSGHFHWSSTNRAHNWIDVSKLLQDKDDLLTCKLAMLDVIRKCKLEDQFDFIIGLGIEGNILATRIAFKYSIPYSYLPYSYRYIDHNDYEKNLNFKNNGDYKSVLLVTDVVHDGRTIRKLINQSENEFFKQVEKIIVLSLFYTGSETKGLSKILNRRNNDDELVRNGYDIQEERIEFFFIKKMKVEECPYGPESNINEECILVKEGIGCIHKFYNDEEL